MKDNSLSLENTQSPNNSSEENKAENKTDKANEPDYLHIFCKDISKINYRDECGWTPLYRTIVSGIVNATELLLNNGADPNIQCSMGETPLYQAVEMEKVPHVNLLLKKGANPNLSQIDGLSPLHSAINKQNILIIKELLKFGADPNNKSKLYEQTPLHLAIKNNVDPMILLILVQYNGSLFIKDKFGKTPLDYVSSEEMRKVIEKLKLENEEETTDKTLKKFSTPTKEMKWSDSKMLSDSIEKDNFKENKIIFKGNVILKEPGRNFYHQIYNRTRSGTIGNENAINNIRKQLFENKYNKKIINESFSTSKNKKVKNLKNTIPETAKYDHINKELFNKIKHNLSQKYLTINKKDKIKPSNKKIPYNNYYSSSKREQNKYSSMSLDEKLINKENRTVNIPFLFKSKNVKYSNQLQNKINYIYDKETKSTGIYSDYSSSINESKVQKEILDYNTITDVKKFTLIPRDSRNNKKSSNYLSQKKSNTQIANSMDNKSINYYQTIDSLSQNLSSVQINECKNKVYKLYKKPKISMNELSIDRNISGYTFNIINNNTVNNKNYFNSSYRSPKALNSSANNLNLLSNDKKKGPLKLKKFKLQKKVFNVKNFSIPFDKKKIPYNNRNSKDSNNTNTNSNGNTYNTINSSNNDSFYESNLSQCIHTKKSNTSLSIYDSIVIEAEKYPIHEWLNEISLACYSPLFIQKKIYDVNKIVEGMKKGKIKMTPKDIYKIGIKVPGHIYRIFVKLELDSGIIDNKIMEIIENKKQGNKNEEINILTNSFYNICGCCSLKERSRSTCRKRKDNVYEIEQWLININMIKYKNNFIENGFDKFEYFFLQMFGNFPIDSNILKNAIGITNEKDRDLILLRLQKDVKYLSLKSKNERNFSNPKIQNTYEQNFINDNKKDSQDCKII